MLIVEIFVVAFALAADAFTVGVAVGMTHRSPRQVFRLSFHFGLFQAMLPLVGALAGACLGPWVGSISHWISFGILQIVGFKMLLESMEKKDLQSPRDPTRGFRLIGLSVAVSIDALAVGFSLGLGRFSIWLAVLVIGLIAGLATLVGMSLAGRIAARIGKRVEPLAALALMALGVKMLVEGL